MAQLLSHASAFNPGYDLWVVPDSAGSRWTLRLDWYLNFQITRARRHRPAVVPAEIDGILRDIEWRPETPAVSPQAPLLLSGDGLIPARWVAVVPDSGDLAGWTARIEALWRNLQQPALKVFLPTGVQASAFSAEWKRKVDREDYSLVLDQDPLLQ